MCDGGLGSRSAEQMRSAAFLASRIEARPFVNRLLSDMGAAGVSIPRCMHLYDEEAAAAMRDLQGSLPQDAAEEVRQLRGRGADKQRRMPSPGSSLTWGACVKRPWAIL